MHIREALQLKKPQAKVKEDQIKTLRRLLSTQGPNGEELTHLSRRPESFNQYLT
jgi:hypothetical protein